MLFLSLVVAAVLMLASSVQGANLIQNGGFETGAFAPQWSVVGGGVTISSSSCHSGAFCAQFSSLLGASILQSVVALDGTSYTLSFWVLSTGLANDFQATAQFAGGPPIPFNILSILPSSYALYSTTIFHTGPPASSIGLTISFSGSIALLSSVFLDDIVLDVTAGVVGDPQFIGLRGQSYQVHGIDGEVYNLVSSANTQINSRFVFLTEGKCPIIDGLPLNNCWSHPGSYLGSIGVQQVVDGKIHQLSIESGSADEGFSSIELNDSGMSLGASFSDGPLFSVSYNSTHSISVQTEEFNFVFENSDMFINQAVTPRVPLSDITAHGLFGQTHKAKKYPSALKYIEGEVDDYVILEGELFASEFVYNRFKVKA